MRWSLVFVALLIVPAVFAGDDSLFTYSHLKIVNTVTSGFRISGGNAEDIVVNLSMFPLDSVSNVVAKRDFEPEPLPNTEFSWAFHNPSLGDTQVRITSTIDSFEQYPLVKKKIAFPLQGLPVELEEYLGPEPIIDITPAIREQAAQIATGKDDLYEVVFALASWTKDNVAYELTSTTADASLPSSWVLQNRKGVCDELTALFMSMSRSLGIPARFVSGVAYSNIGNGSFGPHGWAEVYFPETGWVPFDVTYGEFGFVDSTHVRMQESIDARKDALEVASKGFRVKLETLPLDFESKIVQTYDRVAPGVDIRVSALYDQVGFGSYNGMKITLKNQRDAYHSITLRITKTESLTYLPSQFIVPVLLKPREEKTIIIPVYVDPKLKKGYQYTFPLRAETLRGGVSEDTFTASDDAMRYPLSSITTLPSESKSFGTLTCTLAKPTIRVGDRARVSCIFNPVASALYSFCVATDCFSQRVEANSPFEFSMNKDMPEAGIYGIDAKVSGPQGAMIRIVTARVIDETNVTFSINNFPYALGYDETAPVQVLIIQNSASEPKKMRLELIGEEYTDSWDIDEFHHELNLSFVLEGNRLLDGPNDLTFKLTYLDDLNAPYVRDDVETVVLKPMTFSQKMNYFIGRVSHWVTTLFS